MRMGKSAEIFILREHAARERSLPVEPLPWLSCFLLISMGSAGCYVLAYAVLAASVRVLSGA